MADNSSKSGEFVKLKEMILTLYAKMGLLVV